MGNEFILSISTDGGANYQEVGKVKPCELSEMSEEQKAKLPYEIYVCGKPLLNANGTIFMTDNKTMQEFYAAGHRLVVIEAHKQG